MSTIEITSKIEALKELEALIEEAKAEAEALRDEIKTEMLNRNTEEMEAGQYIVRWTSVLSQRFDSTAFKKVMPDIYKSFTKGAQRLFGGNIGLIYPDFISRDHETRVIADAKYKPLDNIGNRDYLQVLAYMLRFDAKKGYYLYPEAEGADDLQLWLNKGSTYEANVVPRDDICIIKHGLKIPIDAENYESFVSKMQVSESEFRQVFIG